MKNNLKKQTYKNEPRKIFKMEQNHLLTKLLY
jgi:hypothetical protein